MNPMVGAAAMSLSSFTVCMNALRLNLFNMHKDVNSHKNPIIINVGASSNSPEGGKVMTKIVKVDGMMCAHCEAHVKEEFEKNAKVISATASHEKKEVELNLKEDMGSDEAKAIVEKAGYTFVSM
jgi:Cu2+-exporting ATPase